MLTHSPTLISISIKCVRQNLINSKEDRKLSCLEMTQYRFHAPHMVP